MTSTRPLPVTLVLATGNAHKAGEIRAVLGDRHRYLTLKDLRGAPEVVEDAATFAGNAAKKAASLAAWLVAEAGAACLELPTEGTLVLADDSGLEVDALGGAPGVHSARFAALDDGRPGNSPTAENNAKLLRLLREVPLGNRAARFRCVLALASVGTPPPAGADPQTGCILFDGQCPGRIIAEHRGTQGFGYDPLFIPDGYELTFAELGEEVKNTISHRAKALRKLRELLGQGQRST